METTIKSLNKWANAHSYNSLYIMRIILGVFLIYKGASFITNNRAFEDLIAPLTNFLGGMLSFHYIAAAHILGHGALQGSAKYHFGWSIWHRGTSILP